MLIYKLKKAHAGLMKVTETLLCRIKARLNQFAVAAGSPPEQACCWAKTIPIKTMKSTQGETVREMIYRRGSPNGNARDARYMANQQL